MDDTATIRNTIPPWRNAIINRDWDMLVSMCTDDFIFSPPGEPQVLSNRTKSWLETFPIARKLDFSFDRIDVSGNLAVASGHGQMMLEVDGKDMPLNIKFVDVFRRGKDGTWRYAHVIWNLDGQRTTD